MAKARNTKQRILNAAFKEFSRWGFSGTRMDKIANRAGINKAMLHYYFSSKGNLYLEVLKHAVQKIIPRIRDLVLLETNAETFLEKLPDIYITFFSGNQDFVKMVAFDFGQHTDMIRYAFEQTIGNEFRQGPRMILKKIEQWARDGEISEKDPVQFMINIISLCLFAFIARPILETLLNTKMDGHQFIRNRIESVVSLLKKGMLK